MSNPSTSLSLWGRFEATLTSTARYENPLHEVELTAELNPPSGEPITVDGFWDGGQTFRFRFQPDQEGTWRWSTRSSNPADEGLNGQSGAFTCERAGRGHSLLRHGRLRLSQDRTRLCHADGTPFFWLGDTAWEGALLSTETDWQSYLRERKAKRFNVVQVMGTQNLAAAGDMHGRQAFVDRERIVVDPFFWQRLDRRFDACNDRGLVIAPSFSWAAQWSASARALDPGAILPDDQLVVLLRYAQARYGAHHVVWLFGGDIDYGPEADRWRRIGRQVFGRGRRQLVTMHPAPYKLHRADFQDEPWLSILGYQAGHLNDETTFRFFQSGEAASPGKDEPRFPIIDLEPNYEGHRDQHNDRIITAFDVRRMAWWSVLVAPTAGVSYGAHGVWSWELEPRLPMSHSKSGLARPWFEAVKLPGSTHMEILAMLLTERRRPWWRLLPAAELVREQPGRADPAHFVAAAASEDGRLAVLYLPDGGPVALDLTRLGAGVNGRWVDPTSGAGVPAEGVTGGAVVTVTPPTHNAEGAKDFVLLID